MLLIGAAGNVMPAKQVVFHVDKLIEYYDFWRDYWSEQAEEEAANVPLFIAQLRYVDLQLACLGSAVERLQLSERIREPIFKQLEDCLDSIPLCRRHSSLFRRESNKAKSGFTTGVPVVLPSNFYGYHFSFNADSKKVSFTLGVDAGLPARESGRKDSAAP
jgi:hypothetical protein